MTFCNFVLQGSTSKTADRLSIISTDCTIDRRAWRDVIADLAVYFSKKSFKNWVLQLFERNISTNKRLCKISIKGVFSDRIGCEGKTLLSFCVQTNMFHVLFPSGVSVALPFDIIIILIKSNTT